MQEQSEAAQNLCVRTSYVWSEDQFLRSMQHHEGVTRALTLGPVVTALMSGVLLLLLALSWWILIGSGFEASAWRSALIATAIAAYWLWAVQFKAWRRRRYFEQQVSANSVVRWEFSSGHIKAESSFSKSESEWKALSKILEASDGFLLYTYPKNMFFWQPFSGFASPQEIETFKQLAHTSQVPYAKAAS